MGIFDRVQDRTLDRGGFAQRVRRSLAGSRHRVRRYPNSAEMEALGKPSGL